MSVDGSHAENGSLGPHTRKTDVVVGLPAQVSGAKEDRATIRQNRLALVVEEAQRVGVNEDTLRVLTQRLSAADKPMMRNLAVRQYSESLGIEAQDVLRLARGYSKERTRVSEDGELLHYHQTSLDVFDRAAKKGALISHDMLKVLGEAPFIAGTRPDVVQMTRDKYDANGKLVERGLADGKMSGQKDGGLTLVFDESLMDLDEYDCLTRYPNAPTIPFDHLSAVVLDSESERSRAEAIAQQNQLNVVIVTKEEWKTSKYSQKDN